MRDASSSKSGFMIARHAMQALLHEAMVTAPASAFGLLGGRRATIKTVFPLNMGKGKTTLENETGNSLGFLWFGMVSTDHTCWLPLPPGPAP